MKETGITLVELKEKFINNEISPSETRTFGKILSDNNEELTDTRKQLILREALKCAQTSSQETFSNQLKDRIEKSSKETLVSTFPLNRLVLAVASLLLLAALSFIIFRPLSKPNQSNTLIPSPIVVGKISANNNIYSNILIGDTLSKAEGVYTLEFQNNTVVSAQAPFHFKILSANEIYLTHGIIAVHCTTDGSNFLIKRDSSLISDLGTAFIVDGNSDDLKVDVLAGEVSVQTEYASKNLLSGEAVSFPSSTTSKSPFSNYIPDRSAYGDLTKHLLPKNLSLPNNIKIVNFWNIGTEYQGKEDAQIVFEKGGLPLNRSLHVSSYLLRALPKSGDRQLPTHIGKITFPSPIISVISQENELVKFEETHHFSHINDTYQNRGLEGLGQLKDHYSLSEDGKTLEFKLFAHTTIDDLRILVKD